MAVMLNCATSSFVVVRRRRKGHVPVIHAASHVNKGLDGSYFYLYMWFCFFNYGSPLGLGHQSSAINVTFINIKCKFKFNNALSC